MYFCHSGFLSNLRLPWKTVALEIFTVLNILFTFLSNLHLPWKTEVALKFFPVFKYILSFRIFEQLVLPLKTRVSPEFFTVLNMYFLSFRIFEQLALALKNRVALEFFTALKYFFIIQDFSAANACPENRVWPEIFQTRGGRPPPRLVRLWSCGLLCQQALFLKLPCCFVLYAGHRT